MFVHRSFVGNIAVHELLNQFLLHMHKTVFKQRTQYIISITSQAQFMTHILTGQAFVTNKPQVMRYARAPQSGNKHEKKEEEEEGSRSSWHVMDTPTCKEDRMHQSSVTHSLTQTSGDS